MNFMRNPGKQIQVAHTLTATIDGRCAARNSLRKTREYNIECQRGGMDTSLVRVTFLHDGAADRNTTGKFKVVSVYSC